MFERISFSDGVLKFHTAPDVGQSGVATTVRQAGLAFTPETVTLGKYGPFALPDEIRTSTEFQQMIALNDGSIRVAGLSKSPRKRPDWPMLSYAYRIYASHEGITTDRELPALLAQMVESKRQLWNALCERCTQAIEKGQTITAEVLDELAVDVNSTLTAFNDSLGRSKDKIVFPKDDVKEIPAKRIGVYARFVGRLKHLEEEEKPVPEGLLDRVEVVLKQYPCDWSHFGAFEKNLVAISRELIGSMAIPASIAAPVVEKYRQVFKRRRSMKLKGFEGIPHWKDARQFDWFHEFSFGSGGIPVTRLNLKGSTSLKLGTPVSPQVSGHQEMTGRKAKLRTLRPITFNIEGRSVTFAMMMHRPLPENGLLKQWRLLYRDGQYWVNFMLEIPPYKLAMPDEAGEVGGLDFNWRVLDDGTILVGMLTDGSKDTMIVLDMDRSSQATDCGGMIKTFSEGGFRVVSLGVGPSRWGRNNVRTGVNYGVPDTFAGARMIRELRDKAKDELKIRISRMMGDDAPSYLSACGARGLTRLEEELKATHPEVSNEIHAWVAVDKDIFRVTRKLSDLLTGRMKRGYEQLAHHLCRDLSVAGVRWVAIEEKFLKKIAEAVKKYQPEALQNSVRYRHALGLSNLIDTLDHIAAKYGITLSRHKAAYTTSRCRFCGSTCEFGAKRTTQCPGCQRVIDQDQNAAYNLRTAEIEDTDSNTSNSVEEESDKDSLSWTLTIGRITAEGELRQKRDVVLTAKAASPVTS